MDRESLLALIAASPAFSAAPPEALAAVADSMRERHFCAGETLVTEGEPADDLFLLAAGQLQVTGLREGRDKVLGRIGAGETFGEIATLTGGNRLATVKATTAGTLFALPGDDFRKLLRRFPQLAERTLRSLERFLDPG